MRYKDNWEETKERFIAWWEGSNLDRPLMKVVAKRKSPLEDLEETWKAKTPEDQHLEADRKVINLRNYCRTHHFMAEAFPALDINLGAGSMAVYLGSEPEFNWETVWFNECIDDLKEWHPLKYDPENPWLKKHINSIKRAQELAKGDFLVTIPDIIENLDIVSSMRGAQNLCFDLMDEPELVKAYIDRIDDLYFKYYDAFYDIVKGQDGSSSFTVFSIWGPGRVAKLQCDYSAMISPDQFSEFIVPSLSKQCENLDFTLYHLDGPDAIRHVDALMGIEGLDALQWTAGAGQPDGASEKWYPIYDKVVAADKSLWIILSDGKLDDWIEGADRLVKRYGPEKLYLLFPTMEEEEAQKLLEKAERDWK